MLRCAASFVIAVYAKYASFLMICAPCLRIFFTEALNLNNYLIFYEGIISDFSNISRKKY